MNRTQIEWVKSPDGSPGYTWNPITGCLNHIDGLCKGGGFPCYAYRLAHGRLKQRYLANHDMVPFEEMEDEDGSDHWQFHDPFYPRFWEERLYHPWGGEPKGIFVCDMSDLFGIGIPEEWTKKVLNLCRLHEQNRYYLLTKQPANLVRWSPFPDNCYVGVTATTFEQFGIAGIYLPVIEAKVKFISFEPLLGRITDDKAQYNSEMMAMDLQFAGIKWLIIGAQTKPDKLPKIEWVQEIVAAADKAGIPVFLKDNLQPLFEADTKLHGFRQEMPEEVKCKGS